jgi:nucleotide-binding universal stress UspA family protein
MKQIIVPIDFSKLSLNALELALTFAKTIHADLISIMTEQEKSITNILLGSCAHQMINKSSIPVLLFPTKHVGAITESFRTEGIYY